MQIKRFEAKDMSQALKRVKQELGSEAVILSARSCTSKSGLWGSFKKKGVEVTAAVDMQYRGLQKFSRNAKPDRCGHKRLQKAADHHAAPYKKLSRPSTRPAGDSKYPSQTANAVRQSFVGKGGTGHPLFSSLLSQGLHETLASELISALTPAVRRNPGQPLDGGFIRKGLITLLDHKGVSAAPLTLDRNTCKIVVIIGQPGVGKTTTVAKLTVDQSLENDKCVTLITTDSHRIAAAEQLKTYAKIIGVPFEMAFDPGQLKNALVKHRQQDLILIDTPGIGLKDKKASDHVKQLLDIVPFGEIHLVLSATSKEQDLTKGIERLKSFPIKRLIFSKLDETVCHGNIINQLVWSRIPVSYLTNGQSVPEDIQPASLEKIADLICLDGQSVKLSYRTTDAPEYKNSNRRFHASESGNYFIANQNSDIYHVPHCKWNRMIKEENIIVFDSVAEADRKMFKPCRSCSPETLAKNPSSVRTAGKSKIAHSRG